MIGVFVIVGLAVLASAVAVWRVEIARYTAARPTPRHSRTATPMLTTCGKV